MKHLYVFLSMLIAWFLCVMISFVCSVQAPLFIWIIITLLIGGLVLKFLEPITKYLHDHACGNSRAEFLWYGLFMVLALCLHPLPMLAGVQPHWVRTLALLGCGALVACIMLHLFHGIASLYRKIHRS